MKRLTEKEVSDTAASMKKSPTKKTVRIKPPQDSKGWIRWRKLYREMEIECCDCGLVHLFQIRVVKGVVQWRANRVDNLINTKKK